MILRSFTLAIGLVCGLTTAQLPEFSQQYVQRLGGAYDALSEVTQDFDASAKAAGLSRAEALQQLTGTPFLDRRRADMTRAFERHASLGATLPKLQAAPATARAMHLLTRPDIPVARATLDVFQPALPLTADGLLFAGAGGLLGAGTAGAVGRLMRRRPAPA